MVRVKACSPNQSASYDCYTRVAQPEFLMRSMPNSFDVAHPSCPPYRHVAWCYDALASAYSLGAIDRAKAHHHRLAGPGMRVLYAGAGTGREIVAACRSGAEVTCVEPCPAMAGRLHKQLSAAADRFTLVPMPIQVVPAEPAYDLVVAHFFLNLFDTHAMSKALKHLCGFVKPGGRLVIADFKPALVGGSRLDRLLRALYYRPLNGIGRLLHICALHPIYDYAPPLESHGFECIERVSFPVVPGLPDPYEVITARRPEAR